jgi:hypothetical protein
MKKLGFIIAFSAFFAIGMSAQTTQPAPQKGNSKPAATAHAQETPKAKPANADNTSPAKNTVSKNGGPKRHVNTNMKAVPSARPATATAQKQKVQ